MKWQNRIGISTDNQPCPQQLPGPAHPDACPGEEPQQAVSPGPGIRFPEGEDEGADRIFSTFPLLQWRHVGESLALKVMTSLILPQSAHLYSNIGMGFPFMQICYPVYTDGSPRSLQPRIWL